MDSNLTLAQKIIRPHSIDPLEGHTVVVFQTVGTSGEEFKFEIERGERAPTTRLDLWGWLRGRRSDDKYFAYAVNGAPQLRETFSVHVTMDVQAYEFDLVIDLAYSVETPRLVVTWRNQDPVRQVREKVSATMAREFAQQHWTRVCDNFRELERDIVMRTMEPLREFAARYGLYIQEITLSHSLPPEFFDEIRKAEANERAKAEAARQEELTRARAAEAARTAEQEERLKREQAVEAARTAEQEERLKREQAVEAAKTAEQQEQLKRRQLEEESKTQSFLDEVEQQRRLKQIERGDKLTVKQNEVKIEQRAAQHRLANWARLDTLADTVTEAAAEALKRAAESIGNPQQLVQAIRDIQVAVEQIQELSGLAGRPPELSGAASRMALGSYQNGAPAVIAEMFIRTERMACHRHERERLQAAALHIVAELLLNKQADASYVAEQQERLRTARAEINLPLPDADYFNLFLDSNMVRSQLH